MPRMHQWIKNTGIFMNRRNLPLWVSNDHSLSYHHYGCFGSISEYLTIATPDSGHERKAKVMGGIEPLRKAKF